MNQRYFADIYNQHKKNVEGTLFKRLNNYHQNIKLSIELSFTKFIYETLNRVDGRDYGTQEHNKISNPWSSNKQNATPTMHFLGDHARAKRIPKRFDEEVSYIIDKFWKAYHPLCFIDDIVNESIKSTNDEKVLHTISPKLFEKQKPFSLIEILFFDRNGNRSKGFIQKSHEFTDNKFKKVIKFFLLNDKNMYPSCKTFSNYIGETDSEWLFSL